MVQGGVVRRASLMGVQSGGAAGSAATPLCTPLAICLHVRCAQLAAKSKHVLIEAMGQLRTDALHKRFRETLKQDGSSPRLDANSLGVTLRQ
jgi:hypothetical protein